MTEAKAEEATPAVAVTAERLEEIRRDFLREPQADEFNETTAFRDLFAALQSRDEEVARLKAELDDVKGPQFNARLETVANNWRTTLTIFERSRIIGADVQSVMAAFNVASAVYDHEGTVAGEHTSPTQRAQSAGEEEAGRLQKLAGYFDGDHSAFIGQSEMASACRDGAALIRKQASALAEAKGLLRQAEQRLVYWMTEASPAETVADAQRVQTMIDTNPVIMAIRSVTQAPSSEA